MNKYEYLLTKLNEECAEVQIAVSKILRFGPLNYHPDRPDSNNIAELESEICDLWATLDLLDTNGVIDLCSCTAPPSVEKAQSKIKHFMDASRECGTLTD